MNHLTPTKTDEQRDVALGAARAARALLDPPPLDLAPATLKNAYATQSARMQRLGAKMPAAFKLGGTTSASRNKFKCEAPYFGMLSQIEVVNDDTLQWRERIRPHVEPEVAVGMSTTLPPQRGGYSIDQLEAEIAWIAPALDLGDTALADPISAGLAWVLSDGCAAGRLVIGERLGADALSAFEQSLVLVTVNGRVVASGCVQAMIGGVLGALREFLLVLAEYDLALPAGAPVALGGCAPAQPLPASGEVCAIFGDAGSVAVAV